MSAPFKFTVTVSGMDLDAWAIDYGIDRDKADADFAEFAVNQPTARWTSCSTVWATTTRAWR